jgi:hypothetical protein
MNNALHNQDCPPLMSDGRFATDYRPSCYVHDLLMKQNGIGNSYDFKQFMTQNANNMQKVNFDFINAKNNCGSCGGYVLPDPNGHIPHWQKARTETLKHTK